MEDFCNITEIVEVMFSSFSSRILLLQTKRYAPSGSPKTATSHCAPGGSPLCVTVPKPKLTFIVSVKFCPRSKRYRHTLVSKKTLQGIASIEIQGRGSSIEEEREVVGVRYSLYKG